MGFIIRLLILIAVVSGLTTVLVDIWNALLRAVVVLMGTRTHAMGFVVPLPIPSAALTTNAMRVFVYLIWINYVR